jgi:hypothetical protein
MDMTSENLELHIQELALDGFTDVDLADVRAAVQRELARLLAERGVPRPLASGGQTARLDGGAFELPPGAGAEAIGSQIAQALYRGFSQ